MASPATYAASLQAACHCQLQLAPDQQPNKFKLSESVFLSFRPGGTNLLCDCACGFLTEFLVALSSCRATRGPSDAGQAMRRGLSWIIMAYTVRMMLPNTVRSSSPLPQLPIRCRLQFGFTATERVISF